MSLFKVHLKCLDTFSRTCHIRVPIASFPCHILLILVWQQSWFIKSISRASSASANTLLLFRIGSCRLSSLCDFSWSISYNSVNKPDAFCSNSLPHANNIIPIIDLKLPSFNTVMHNLRHSTHWWSKSVCYIHVEWWSSGNMLIVNRRNNGIVLCVYDVFHWLIWLCLWLSFASACFIYFFSILLFF